MKIHKVKISPEVIRNELITQTYSGVSFGYYSGLTNVLTAGTINLGQWRINNTFILPGYISYFFPFPFSLGEATNNLGFNKIDSKGKNWGSYLSEINSGSTITLTDINMDYVIFRVTSVSSFENIVSINVSFVELSGIVNVNTPVNVTIQQPGTSQLIDLSIPVLLEQSYEDVGYYSVWDGEISQLNEEVNFTFVFSDNNPNEITIYNTSDNKKTYLKQATYKIDWGDGTPIQDVTVFIPESISHTYATLPDVKSYTIRFYGKASLGNYEITKTINVPYYNSPTINNPYGEINFTTNNGSWSTSPSSQNYINYYDTKNTVEDQASYNYVSVPFVISGYTTSRLQELKVYGTSPYVNDLSINLKDGTTGKVISQSPEYTAYTINSQNYLDFPDGKSVFVVQSYGLTEEMLVASAITKMEYLMNVIEQPEIQSNVFIERGKNSGMENFRRIGEVGNTGSLDNYGYKFFDVRNYNDI